MMDDDREKTRLELCAVLHEVQGLIARVYQIGVSSPPSATNYVINFDVALKEASKVGINSTRELLDNEKQNEKEK